MLVFDPTHLKDDIFSALEKFSFLEGTIDEINFSAILNVASHDGYDATVTENSKVCFFYLGYGDDPASSVKFLLDASNCWEDSKLNESQSYAKSKNELEYLLYINDYDSIMLLEALKDSNNSVVHDRLEGTSFWDSWITVNNKTYNVSLFHGLSLYHLLVEASGNVDKYHPSYSEDDYFIRVICDSDIDPIIADSLAVSFVFELLATHNIKVSFSGGRTDSSFFDYDSDALRQQSYEIFPLLYGRGIKELLELYNTAKITNDVDYRILSFTKVIEYISPTISKEELLEAVRLKLTSPTIFAPTSEFIIELSGIFKKHQNDINKDSELIKLAVTTVAQLSDVWDCLPRYIKPKQPESIELLDDNARKSCIENLVAAICDTRNEIAHAKANYEKKGKECPTKDRLQFCEVLDRIAVRCIRWFALQPEEKRVVLS